jgi:hypothetical protein
MFDTPAVEERHQALHASTRFFSRACFLLSATTQLRFLGRWPSSLLTISTGVNPSSADDRVQPAHCTSRMDGWLLLLVLLGETETQTNALESVTIPPVEGA